MKLYNITDIDKFFEMINQCEGKVELVSPEGDRINLKSTLCQFIAREVFHGAVEGLELVAYNPEDSIKIMKYMINR